MPRTHQFSEEFYEKLGHGIANEFIDWANDVDLAYRTELRDQNESNFQKFESVLRGEIAALEARLDGKMEVGFATLRTEMADLRAELTAGQAMMFRWMVVLFLGAVLTVIGLG